MEISIFGYVFGGLVLLAGLFFKNQADKAFAESEVAKVQVKDAPLAAKQADIEAKIHAVENQDDSKLSPQERADRWNK